MGVFGGVVKCDYSIDENYRIPALVLLLPEWWCYYHFCPRSLLLLPGALLVAASKIPLFSSVLYIHVVSNIVHIYSTSAYCRALST